MKSKKQVLTGKAEERFTEVWVACDYVVKLYMVSIHGSGGRTDDLKESKNSNALKSACQRFGADYRKVTGWK